MIRDVFSDANWNAGTERGRDWEKPGFKEAWPWAVELTGDSSWRASIERQLRTPLALATRFGRVRASLVYATPLTTALGRPNREQVTTVRQNPATTLQALELTNGKTLDELLQRGAKKLLANHPGESRALVAKVFLKALGRPPTEKESALATDMLGSPARAEGVEDLLWSVAMLPEFQLIY